MQRTIGFVFSHADLSGAPRKGCHFVRACQEAGHRVVAATGPPPPAASAPLASVVDALAELGIASREFPGFERPLDLLLVQRITSWLRQERVDCVVSLQQNTVKIAGWAARRAGVPFVYHASAHPRFHGKPVIRLLKRHAFGLFLRRCAALSVCPSHRMERDLVNQFGVDPESIRILLNGIEIPPPTTPSTEERAEVRAELGVGQDELLVLNVGRIDPPKGQLVAVEALGQARLPRALKLVFVGPVSLAGEQVSRRYAERVQGVVRRLGLSEQVRFTGWRDDVPRLLAAADAYLHPSVSEGFPLAIVEAWAAGLPSVITDCSGHPEGFRDGREGFIVPSRSPGALARALERIAGLDAEARRAMGAAARALAESRYDMAQLGVEFAGFVDEALRGSRLRR